MILHQDRGANWLVMKDFSLFQAARYQADLKKKSLGNLYLAFIHWNIEEGIHASTAEELLQQLNIMNRFISDQIGPYRSEQEVLKVAVFCWRTRDRADLIGIDLDKKKIPAFEKTKGFNEENNWLANYMLLKEEQIPLVSATTEAMFTSYYKAREAGNENRETYVVDLPSLAHNLASKVVGPQ
jgi:hypothetical protein